MTTKTTSELKAKISDLEHQIMALKKAHAKKIVALKKAHAEEIAALKKQHAEQIATLHIQEPEDYNPLTFGLKK